MLRPIPSRILRQSAVFKVCTGVNDWSSPTYEEIPINHVAIQPTERTSFTKDDTQVTLTAVLFIDARRSTKVDPAALKAQSEANKHALVLRFNGIDYTVMSVDTLYDDESKLHHYEVGLF